MKKFISLLLVFTVMSVSFSLLAFAEFKNQPPSCPGCEEYVIDNDNKTLSIQSNILIGQFISDMKNRGEINVTVYKNGQKVIYGYFEVGMTVDMHYFDGTFAGTYTFVAPEIGVITKNNEFLFKKGGIAESWEKPIANVKDLQLTTNNLDGILKTNNDLYLRKDGTNNWERVLNDCQQFKLSGNRIGSIQTNGSLVVKDGMYSTWNTVSTKNIVDFSFDGNRIYMLDSNGNFYVREGIGGNTVLLTNNCKSFSTDGDNICFITNSGNLYLKQSIYGVWILICNPVSTVHVDGNRFYVTIGASKSFYVKEGVYGTWLLLDTEINKFQVEGNTIFALKGTNLIYKKAIKGVWFKSSENTIDFKFDRQRLARLSSDKTLYVKDGLESVWISMPISYSVDKFDITLR